MISFFIALLTIIQNLLNLYVSPVILSAIENHVSIQELLFTIVIFVLMIMLVSAALAYANQNVICGRISVRCEIVNLLNKKSIHNILSQYRRYEIQKITDQIGRIYGQ